MFYFYFQHTKPSEYVSLEVISCIYSPKSFSQQHTDWIKNIPEIKYFHCFSLYFISPHNYIVPFKDKLQFISRATLCIGTHQLSTAIVCVLFLKSTVVVHTCKRQDWQIVCMMITWLAAWQDNGDLCVNCSADGDGMLYETGPVQWGACIIRWLMCHILPIVWCSGKKFCIYYKKLKTKRGYNTSWVANC